ncbi:hypothetical protein FHS88_002031 [Roseomonas alkaliterrae]|uniref:Uncharacterized protein n=1 Tax=Neoroseomonas alkaliterrae TaxID=1452450 RepID=A0A840XMU3_9PROT|nr:hypothetical protein [Neoroseomonas alkaliterrae]
MTVFVTRETRMTELPALRRRALVRNAGKRARMPAFGEGLRCPAAPPRRVGELP